MVTESQTHHGPCRRPPGAHRGRHLREQATGRGRAADQLGDIVSPDPFRGLNRTESIDELADRHRSGLGHPTQVCASEKYLVRHLRRRQRLGSRLSLQGRRPRKPSTRCRRRSRRPGRRLLTCTPRRTPRASPRPLAVCPLVGARRHLTDDVTQATLSGVTGGSTPSRHSEALPG